MFASLQPITTIGEGEFAATELEEAAQTINSEMPAAPKGKLQVGQKIYTFTPKSETPGRFTQALQGSLKKSHMTPMGLAKMSYQSPSSTKHPTPLAKQNSMPKLSTKESFPQKDVAKSTTTTSHPKFAEATRKGERTVQTPRGQERSEQRENRQQNASLQSRQWNREETTSWWEQRYHQKEREGRQGQEREQQQEQPKQNDKGKSKRLSGACAASTSTSQSLPVYREGGQDVVMKKPSLERPRTGVFALYYILTKIGIVSDSTSNFSYKKEIESIDNETTAAHNKRLEELKIAIEKERAASRWSVANKVFSWIGSFVSVIAGAVMIATGVGAVAGAMLVVGGVIQITNQILEMTGGWKKIAELLPGNDSEKKRAVIAWMQIGITVLCLILSGVGVIWGGYSNFGKATQTAMALFGGVVSMGSGTVTIGEGIVQFMYNNKLGEVKRYDKILAELKHKRQDLMEKVEWGIDRLEQLFEDLARALDFEIELFQAEQMMYR